LTAIFLTYDDHKMIIGHRNYQSYDEVIKLPFDEFLMIYDHHNIFRKCGH